jgi:predicted acyl esterase
VFTSDGADRAAEDQRGSPSPTSIASTTGTDADWVVKVIDVYPDEVAAQPELGGYQLMVSPPTSSAAAIATSYEKPKPIDPGKALRYRFDAAHRQPRVPARPPRHGAGPVELVPALRPQPADLRAQHLLAKPGDYQQATQRVHHAPGQASFIELPRVTRP